MAAHDALLLDFGGTLATERTPRHVIYAEAARALGAGVTDDAMGEHMAAAHAELDARTAGATLYTRPWFERFIERIFGGDLGLHRTSVLEAQARLFERFADPATFAAYEDGRALVAAARERGLAVAVVSNWSDTLEVLIDALELGPFDAVAASAVLGCEKPDARIFRWTLEELGVAPARALHVGDSWECDVVGARLAGIDAVLLARDGDPRGVPTLHDVIGRL